MNKFIIALLIFVLLLLSTAAVSAVLDLARGECCRMEQPAKLCTFFVPLPDSQQRSEIELSKIEHTTAACHRG